MAIGLYSRDLAASSAAGQRVSAIGCLIGFANFHMFRHTDYTDYARYA
jgi:hypothetical protein